MNMKCVIADDEYLGIKILEEYIRKISFITVSATFKNPLEALEFLQKNEVDLLLLDIQMPYLSGMEMLKKLSHKPMVIFTTARHEFAVQAFELNVLDYLVKPFSFERFLSAVEKAKEYMELRMIDNEQPKFLLIKSDYKMVRLPFAEIMLIEGLSEYVKVHTKEKKIITLAALKDLETQLPADEFIRIHKSYIISNKHISSYNNSQVKLSNGLDVPVGRVYKENFLKHIQKMEE